MAITFRTSKGAALTHVEMDENFSSVYFSSSIHDIPNSTSKELKLWFDTDVPTPTLYDSVIIPAPGAGTVTITGDVNNRVLTAAGNGTIQGEENLTFNGSILTLAGRFEPADTLGNTNIGANTGQDLNGTGNLAVGYNSLGTAQNAYNNVAIGNSSLLNLYTGDNNTAIGYGTADNVDNGNGNIYVGHGAGPSALNVTQNNKLYINNAASNTPLILGDFATGQVTIKSQVSASVFSGSFVGNGAGLTGVSTEWDGTRDGFAQITGSLVVSGSTPTTVRFLNMTAISGSVFSGSFVGDGSGLTGITANSEWDGTRNGNAEITGSFIVSGSSPTINLKGITTVHTNIKIHNPAVDSIGIGVNTLSNSPMSSIALGYGAGTFAENSTVTLGTYAGNNAGPASIYVGTNAGGSNTGGNVVAIGTDAMAKSNRTDSAIAIGYQALFQSRFGSGNIAIGEVTLFGLRAGVSNTAVGTRALSDLGKGSTNTAIGYSAGSTRLTQGGFNNIYLGPYSGRSDVAYEENQLYIDIKQRNDALVRGDFTDGVRSLTLNALKIFMPELLDIQQDPVGVDALPIGALYKDGPFIMVRVP